MKGAVAAAKRPRKGLKGGRGADGGGTRRLPRSKSSAPQRKNSVSRGDAESSEGLPAGWAKAPLGEVARLNPRHPRDLPDSLKVSFAPMAALSEDAPAFIELQERTLGAVRNGFTNFANGDVLFAKITPCMENGKGAVAGELQNGLGCGTTELHVLRPLGGIDPHYVYRFLAQPSVRRSAKENFTGTAGQARVPVAFIQELEIPLAPLPEQRRIVAKLEALLGHVDACRKRLDRVPILLKRFRQAVLAAACSGRLTADWREERPEMESGIDLLARIRVARITKAGTAKERNQIDEAFGDACRIPDEDELGLEGIPDSWVACRIGAIGTVLNGSTPSRKQPGFWSGKIPWVSSGEVRNNLITNTREKITTLGFESCSVRLLPRGAVLVAMIGEGKTRGQSAVLGIEATINQNVAAIVIPNGLVCSDFVWRWFHFQYEATRERGSGSGPQALNCQRVRELPFVLPPLPEQHEIVRRVEDLFKLADGIEARYTKARAQVEALTPALLAKAFRGELVPQNPSDEPAAVLLERIMSKETG